MIDPGTRDRVREFSFELTADGPALETTQTELAARLGDRLRRELTDAQGEAITELSLRPRAFDQGSAKLSGGCLGTSAVLFAVASLVTSFTLMKGDPTWQDARLPLGLVGAGAGVLALERFVISTPSRWTFDVSGVVVRRTPVPAPAVEAAPQGKRRKSGTR